MLRLKKLREVRESPVCHRGNGSGKVSDNVSSLVEKTEEAAKGSCHDPGTRLMRMAYHKPGDVLQIEFVQCERSFAEALGQKRAGCRDVVVQGCLREATLLREIAREILLDIVQGAALDGSDLTGEASVAQMLEQLVQCVGSVTAT